MSPCGPVDKSYCLVSGCKHTKTHTTSQHTCRLCNWPGHDAHECGCQNKINNLDKAIRGRDEVCSHRQCVVEGCMLKEKHTTEGHRCLKCNYFHSNTVCSIDCISRWKTRCADENSLQLFNSERFIEDHVEEFTVYIRLSLNNANTMLIKMNITSNNEYKAIGLFVSHNDTNNPIQIDLIEQFIKNCSLIENTFMSTGSMSTGSMSTGSMSTGSIDNNVPHAFGNSIRYPPNCRPRYWGNTIPIDNIDIRRILQESDIRRLQLNGVNEFAERVIVGSLPETPVLLSVPKKCPMCRLEHLPNEIIKLTGMSEECKICMDNEIQYAFSKCGHACICETCITHPKF